MINLFKYGPTKKIVKIMVWLSWPIIIAGKKWSNYPLLKTIINPFFKRPHNEVTSIPINAHIDQPENIPLPQRVLEKLVKDVDEKFVLDECICRRHNKVSSPPQDIGCLVLGPSSSRIHPSNGRRLTTDESIAHIRRAASEGLIANIAHVWIDPLAYWTNFRKLLFVCFCDDENCLYRTYMKNRGPNLDGAFKKLAGIHVNINQKKCSGCGICEEKCFVAAISMQNRKAVINQQDCKGCGKCVQICPEKAAFIKYDDENKLYEQVRDRIKEVSDLPMKEITKHNISKKKNTSNKTKK